jgi:predicted RNA-binding protein with TRAM domain
VRSRKEDSTSVGIQNGKVKKLDIEEVPQHGEGKKAAFGTSILSKGTSLRFLRSRGKKGEASKA